MTLAGRAREKKNTTHKATTPSWGNQRRNSLYTCVVNCALPGYDRPQQDNNNNNNSDGMLGKGG